jgi:hypothetical protein
VTYVRIGPVNFYEAFVKEQVNNNPPTYTYFPPSPFVVSTGSGSNTVNILDTSAGITISIVGHGWDTVNVGDNGSVQGIVGAVSVENPPSYTTLNIDDSADPNARTATITTVGSNPADSEGNSDVWGSVTGLAPAAISYEYDDTGSVHLTTGHGGDTVNVLATGVPTYLSSGGGADTVNVGSGGSIQGIRGALYVENPPWYTTLNIDDSADAAAGTCYLYTITPGFDPVPWGSIAGLAPATINFEWADVNDPVNISTSGGEGAVRRWVVNPNASTNTNEHIVGVLVNGFIINQLYDSGTRLVGVTGD